MSMSQQPQSSRSRQPAGIPVGGQFAASARAESEVTLGGEVSSTAPADPATDDHFVYPEITDAQHGDEFLQGTTWHRIADAKVFADDTMIKIDFVHGGGVTLLTVHKPRIRRNAVPVVEQAARDHAASAIESFESALYGQDSGSVDRAAAELRMLAAARDLREHVPADVTASLDAAVTGYTSASERHAKGAANRLHAEIVDAMERNVPSRGDVADGAARVEAASQHLRETAVARDIGVASEDEVAEARRRHGEAVTSLRTATDTRRRARQKRLLAGRPTINDLQEAQALADQARTERRDAVNAADRARATYVETPSDSPDFDRRRLAADDATRTEGEKQHAYERAKRELDVGNAAWSKRNQGSVA